MLRFSYMKTVLCLQNCFAEEEELRIKNQADEQAKSMSLNVVRLSFHGYILNEQGACIGVLPRVISDPIYDSSKYFRLVIDDSCLANILFFFFCNLNIDNKKWKQANIWWKMK